MTDRELPTATSPQVMLLSLWSSPGAAWHVRLVDTDARVHEFSSPFELARFLAQAGTKPLRDVPGGLR